MTPAFPSIPRDSWRSCTRHNPCTHHCWGPEREGS
uniref:Uncharacterized protein n=1 Tax=Arundo donax TaxID=35708 RepID=A0A0A9E2E8_ARUDO